MQDVNNSALQHFHWLINAAMERGSCQIISILHQWQHEEVWQRNADSSSMKITVYPESWHSQLTIYTSSGRSAFVHNLVLHWQQLWASGFIEKTFQSRRISPEWNDTWKVKKDCLKNDNWISNLSISHSVSNDKSCHRLPRLVKSFFNLSKKKTPTNFPLLGRTQFTLKLHSCECTRWFKEIWHALIV